MKINHNMSAVVANNQLLRNENALTKSVERLSSGLKINRAADDAAGMAISTKMRAQIKGLNQASQNASDGVSVIETADGALQEVTSMLQRMRELSVQASNGTNALEDKEAIQAEIASLTEEIDRVSRDTEFNTKKLLNGSLDKRVYTNDSSVSRIDISDTVSTGKYTIEVLQDARQAVFTGDSITGNTVPSGASGKISINGVEVEIKEGQDLEEVYENLRKTAEVGGVNVFAVTPPLNNTLGDSDTAGYVPEEVAAGKNLVFVSDAYGSSTEMKITCDNPNLITFLGITDSVTVKGIDALIDLGNGFSAQASCSCDGNNVTITDRNGYKMTFMVDSGTAQTTFTDVTAADANTNLSGDVLVAGVFPVNPTTGTEIIFDVTDIGTMTLQIGANEHQVMEVRIPEVSSKSLYIDKVNVTTVNGADKAISTYDQAIAKVSEVRSRLGAYENRLDHAIGSLDGTELNMTSALSRIEDADMAEEMTTYTQYTVLTQAATSVLAQANDIPQQVLQLLQ